VLVGRRREEQLLDDLLDDARADRSAVLAIVGEVGMGKSSLVAYAESRAVDMNVLRARGIQSEARIPFAALFALLRPALRHLDDVAKPQREALEGALALRPARAQDRFAIGAATLGLLSAYSEEKPLLVLVDDAHWLDGSTADALLFAVRRLVADPIAVLLTVRDGEPSLLDGADLPAHVLEGLDRDSTAALVAQQAEGGVMPPDDAIDRLHRGTGGNPLAVIELAKDGAAAAMTTPLDAPLPVGARVARVYRDRYEALPQPARDMLLLASTSDSGELLLLARAAEPMGLDIADLAAAEKSGLVDIAGGHVEFRHPLVRSAVYSGVPADRRREMHRALAAALPDAEADQRAWHLALAALGPDDAACSALEQAGNRARARSAYDVASRAFERAGELAAAHRTRSALLYAAADTAWLGGMAARAAALLDSARVASPPIDISVPIEHLRGHIATRLGPIGEAQRILLDGAELAADVDADTAVVMVAEAVNAAFYAGDPAAMREAARRIPQLTAKSTSGLAAFFGAMAQGMALIFGGEGEEGAAFVRDAIAVVESSDELSGDPRLLAWAAMGPLWLREAEAGRALIGRAVEMARQQSAVGVLPFLLSHVAIDQVGGDRWPEAEAGFHEAILLARETGQQTDLAMTLCRLAWLEARQGREEDCRAHAAEANVLSKQFGLGVAELWTLAALGELELGLGHLDAALAQFEQQHAAILARGVGDVDISPEPELVELLVRLGRRDEAAAHLASFERHAIAKGQPWALARAARCRGQLAPDDEIDRHFTEALAWHEQTPDVFEAARTRLAYGARLRRARQRVRAREQLRAALEAFDRLCAVPWSEVARAELAATGETARRRDLSTRDHLTPQELQVALLLASGRTTREAAAALFLSPKTIEYHLRSIYRKLDVNSRDELAAAMTAAEPVQVAPAGA
jgi:DNA-binding CsgD family transcriptional regulator/tetratricopeptide (TPR) repeat protein